MLSNPKNGWCNFTLGDFRGSPSYITDVPIDILQACVDYYEKGSGIAWFDEEGSEFSFVLTPYSCFIIEEKETPILHDFSEMNVTDMIKEIVHDIESNIDSWMDFLTSPDGNKQKILKMINYLKNKLNPGQAKKSEKLEITELEVTGEIDGFAFHSTSPLDIGVYIMDHIEGSAESGFARKVMEWAWHNLCFKELGAKFEEGPVKMCITKKIERKEKEKNE